MRFEVKRGGVRMLRGQPERGCGDSDAKASGEVAQLQLYGNSLDGSLPSEVGSLTRMSSYFQLYSNALTGPIPTQFGALSEMTIIYILSATVWQPHLLEAARELADDGLLAAGVGAPNSSIG